MIELSAAVACTILAALAVFQLLLVAGAPLGHFAWGGAQRVLPVRLRIGSIVSICLYAIFAAFILTKSTLAEIVPGVSAVDVGMWVLTVYFCLGVVMNAISRSKPERMLMTPVALVLAVLFFMVAQS